MKNSTIRSFCIGLVVIASIASFTYINTVNVRPSNKNAIKELKGESVDKSDQMTLPDVRIVKKILDKSVAFIPK